MHAVFRITEPQQTTQMCWNPPWRVNRKCLEETAGNFRIEIKDNPVWYLYTQHNKAGNSHLYPRVFPLLGCPSTAVSAVTLLLTPLRDIMAWSPKSKALLSAVPFSKDAIPPASLSQISGFNSKPSLLILANRPPSNHYYRTAEGQRGPF